MGKQFAGQALSSLLAAVVALVVVWMMFTPSTVTRGEMTNYVQVTSGTYMEELRQDIRDLRKDTRESGQRLAAVEAVLKTLRKEE